MVKRRKFFFKPSPAKWSGNELLGHLIGSAQDNIRRFVLAQYEDEPYIVYAQDNWVTAADRNVQTEEMHSIEWMAADYNKHLLHHLHQILHLEEIAYL